MKFIDNSNSINLDCLYDNEIVEQYKKEGLNDLISTEKSLIFNVLGFQKDLLLTQLDNLKILSTISVGILALYYVIKPNFSNTLINISFIIFATLLILIISYTRETVDITSKNTLKSLNETFKKDTLYVNKIVNLKSGDELLNFIEESKKDLKVELTEGFLYVGEFFNFLFLFGFFCLMGGLFIFELNLIYTLFIILFLALVLSFSNWSTFLIHTLSKFISFVSKK